MHLHLDCQFGIAGDMLLASLIDAGADQATIVDTLRAIPLDGFNLLVSRTERGGVSANLLDVFDFTQTSHSANAGAGHPGCHGQGHHGDAPCPHRHEHHDHDAPRSNDPHDQAHQDAGAGHGCCGGKHHHPSEDGDADPRSNDPHDEPDGDGGRHKGCCGKHHKPPGHHHHGDAPRSNDPHDPAMTDHDHDHAHEQDHTHHHHSHDGAGHHHHDKGGPHRHLSDLMKLLDSPVLSDRVRERAARVFRIVAEAEATVHGRPVERVHFHEISGIDTAVDVIGSCIALDLLDVDSISAAPPAAGSGMLMCEHGIFPVPAPATLEIFKSHNIPWHSGGEGERTTPTGAALLAGLVQTFGDSPEITVTRIGYGAGHRVYEEAPNLLRAIIGKPAEPREASGRRESSKTIVAAVSPEPSAELVRIPPEDPRLPAPIAAMLPGDVADGGERVVEFRFVVDDMTSETVGHLLERALAAGALEAYATPVTMKKSRPGHEVTVLALTETAPVVADVLWRESTTFGMRVGERSRLVLQREFRTVHVLGHDIHIKIGWREGVVIRRQPEFEDCRSAAVATGVPIVEVFRMAQEAAQREPH
ncbi:MAG: LarC family nickel insertion protein [Planctomycetes bacterium]|nr:LarC family nickel insertion protein [Planctomycetota bacterium]